MTETQLTLREYVSLGNDLTGFKIVEMTEVWANDGEGINMQTFGVFKDPDAAKAFAASDPSPSHFVCEATPVLVLTDGNVGFIIRNQGPVKFL